MKSQKAFRLPLLIVWFIIVFLLEIFVFNAVSFHTVGGQYEKTPLSLSDAVIQGGVQTDDGVIEVTDGTLVLEWTDLHKPIGTVFADCKLSSGANVQMTVDASDDTYAAYRVDIASKKITAFVPRSRTAVLRMSGNVHNLRVSFTVPKNDYFRLQGITVNRPVPFHFSFLRVGLLCVLGFFVWWYLSCTHAKQPCADNRATSWLLNGITVCCVIAAFLMVNLYATANTDGLLNEFRLTSGNQMTQELVDAFEHKQLHLLTEPSAELLALENPYDDSARTQAGVSYLWDHCLYNGKYYSYYGIAPVLLLFLPYHLLTGYYFSTVFAILIFGCVGIVFLSMVYKLFIRKFFPDLPLGLAVFGLLVLQMSSGIWYCFCAMNFYEIAQSAGFCFTVMGIYFLLKSNSIGDGNISKGHIAAGTTCLSLAVLSRPTTAVYCIVALVVLGLGFRKLIKTDTVNRRHIATYLTAALLPFVVFGGVQMLYNYLRFDSFLDFGIQYSLTINDFTKAQFHPRFVTIGLYNYLLAPPTLSPVFPYAHSAFQMLEPNGYYFVANDYAVGLLWRAPVILGLLFAPKAFKRLKREQRLPAALTIGSFSVAAPLVVLFSIWESGYGVRYAVDFTWEMVLGALAIVFFLYQYTRNNGLRKWSNLLALWSLLPTAVINFALTYTFFQTEVYSDVACRIYAILESVFNFWF